MRDHEDREHMLSAWLREVADDDAATGASPAVQARLLEEVRALRRTRRATAVKMYALAAGLVVATVLPVWQLTSRSSPELASPPLAFSTDDSEVATRFFPLTYSDLPVTHGSIVRVAVPPAAVAALGVEPVAALGSQSDVVLADVLVGEDGLARAVRFVRTSR